MHARVRKAGREGKCTGAYVCTRCRKEQAPVTMAASRGGHWVTGPREGRRIFFSLNSHTSKGSGGKPSLAFDQLCDLGLVT